MSTPDLLYGEVEQDLATTVRDLLRDHCDPISVLARCEQDQSYDLDLWRRITRDLGLAALHVPEERGGAGAGVREVAVLAEELGRAVAPVPFLGTLLATTALAHSGTDQAHSGTDQADATEVVRELAGGTVIGTLAVGMTSRPAAPPPTSVRVSEGTLSGSVPAVADLPVADRVVVPTDDGLYLVDTAAAGVSVRETTPLDLTRRFGTLTLDGVAARRLTGGADAERAVRAALRTGAGVLASEQTGLAELCLESTVEYALTRYQFGRAIGSFQAVKHRLADLWSQIATARATARNAADTLTTAANSPGSAEEQEAELSVAVAQAYCSDVVVLAAEESVQLHGGIGMTWEHPAHLHLGRAKSSQLTFGTPEHHRARVAELVDLPTP